MKSSHLSSEKALSLQTLNASPQSSYTLTEKDNTLYLYTGEVREFVDFATLEKAQSQHDNPVIFLNPFHSIQTERGYEALGKEPIVALFVDQVQTCENIREKVQDALRDAVVDLESGLNPLTSDEDFMKMVKRVKTEEINTGNLCQVILSRVFQGQLQNFTDKVPLEIFRRLLLQEGQFLTFLFADRRSKNTDDHIYLVGATPEQHLGFKKIPSPRTFGDFEIRDKHAKVTMMPIAGTFKKGSLSGKALEEALLEFIRDEKEKNELFQVVDEELKMMAKICPEGGRILGPFLKEIGGVIHTEYKLEGIADMDVISSLGALRETLHAPTLVGGPMESAARVIAHRETESRRYYGGEIGVLHTDGSFDSAIMIRSAEITGTGEVRVQAGAGIVRDSDPRAETDETTAKASGMRRALENAEPISMVLTDEIKALVEAKLQERNDHMSRYHLEIQNDEVSEVISGKRITILDNEDHFSHVLRQMIERMGGVVTVVRSLDYDPDDYDSDLVLIGPGPGDINQVVQDAHTNKMKHLDKVVPKLMKSKTPVMGVCLGHQAIARSLGMEIKIQGQSTQGMQREIAINGISERLAFYNSYSPLPGEHPKIEKQETDDCNRVMRLKGENFESFQFHPESIMSKNGASLLKSALERLLQ